MRVNISKPWYFHIYIAGDYETAIKTCQKYCNEVSYCVSVVPTDYVHAGEDSPEKGVKVTLINYPRFPEEKGSGSIRAKDLAIELLQTLGQTSFTIDNNGENHTFYSNKEEL